MSPKPNSNTPLAILHVFLHRLDTHLNEFTTKAAQLAFVQTLCTRYHLPYRSPTYGVTEHNADSLWSSISLSIKRRPGKPSMDELFQRGRAIFDQEYLKRIEEAARKVRLERKVSYDEESESEQDGQLDDENWEEAPIILESDPQDEDFVPDGGRRQRKDFIRKYSTASSSSELEDDDGGPSLRRRLKRKGSGSFNHDEEERSTPKVKKARRSSRQIFSSRASPVRSSPPLIQTSRLSNRRNAISDRSPGNRSKPDERSPGKERIVYDVETHRARQDTDRSDRNEFVDTADALHTLESAIRNALTEFLKTTSGAPSDEEEDLRPPLGSSLVSFHASMMDEAASQGRADAWWVLWTSFLLQTAIRRDEGV